MCPKSRNKNNSGWWSHYWAFVYMSSMGIEHFPYVAFLLTDLKTTLRVYYLLTQNVSPTPHISPWPVWASMVCVELCGWWAPLVAVVHVAASVCHLFSLTPWRSYMSVSWRALRASWGETWVLPSTYFLFYIGLNFRVGLCATLVNCLRETCVMFATRREE